MILVLLLLLVNFEWYIGTTKTSARPKIIKLNECRRFEHRNRKRKKRTKQQWMQNDIFQIPIWPRINLSIVISISRLYLCMDNMYGVQSAVRGKLNYFARRMYDYWMMVIVLILRIKSLFHQTSSYWIEES